MSQAASVAVRRKHPPGLWVLFIVEMWERYSYYGMRALLVLYLIAKTTGIDPRGPGFGWSKGSANELYGWYCGLTYLTPVLGGWLADKLLGTHRSMVIGGLIIALGQFCLAGVELFGYGTAQVITLSTMPATCCIFIGGLALIVIGAGFFKPCAAVMVGQLYDKDDPRRDSAYTIFYMGINTGAFIAPLVTGWLALKFGWHWGFASAGVGMLLGLVVYQILRPVYLKGIGLPPHHKSERDQDHTPTPEETAQAEADERERTRPLTRIDWDRMIVIVLLTMFAIIFWLGMQQSGASLNIFAEEKTDRAAPFLEGNILKEGEAFPAPWYQSVNPIAIILFAPVFAWLWGWLDRRGMQPSTPTKFGIGLMLIGVAYIAMIFGALQASKNGLAGPQWLVITYVVATFGELCVSPVGLSMVTKLSPARYQSMMMGLYFGILFFANTGAGYLAAWGTKVDEWGKAGDTWWLPGQADFFLVLTVIPILVGLLVLILSPKIKRMMHGIH